MIFIFGSCISRHGYNKINSITLNHAFDNTNFNYMLCAPRSVNWLHNFSYVYMF